LQELYRRIVETLFKKKFGKDTIWILCSQIALVAASFGINLLIGAKMSAADLGIYSLSLSYYVVFSVIFCFGLNITTVQKVSANSNDLLTERKIFTSNIVITLILSTLLTMVLIGLLMNVPGLLGKDDQFNSYLITCVLALPFFNLNKIYMAFYSGKRDQKRFSLLRLLRWVFIFVAILALVFSDFEIGAILYVFLFTEVSLLVLNLIWKHDFCFLFDKHIVKENLSFGIKSYAASIVSELNDKLDIIIIALFVTNSELGVYSFVIFFAKSLYIFPGILQQNISPIIATLWIKQDLSKIRANIASVRKVNFVLIALQAVAVIVLYNLIVTFVKKEFLDTATYLYISIIGVFTFASVYWAGSILTMTQKLNANILRTVLVFILSIIITYSLCSTYGLMGAVLSVSINGFISFLLLKYFIKRTLNISV
jgi:O-antigen/teichoic acid export membrane protein